MKIAQVATGKRRYGLGERNAPTRGQVNPAGYIKRELANQNKKPVSQRRSGLAQAALKNIPNRMPAKNRAPGQPGSVHNGVGKLTQPVIKSAPGILGQTANTASAPRPPAHSNPIMNSVGTTPQVPTVKINANGQLDLPFDEAFSLGLIDQQQQANTELMDLQQQEQAQQMEHQRSLRDADIEFGGMKRNTLNQNAAGGTAFSSQYGVGASRDATNYNNYTNDLNANNAMARNGFEKQRMGIQNSMADYIRQAVLRQGMEKSGEAGTLGYGTSTPEVRPMPTKKAAPKPTKKAPAKKTAKKAPAKKTAKKTAPKKSAGFRAEKGKGTKFVGAAKKAVAKKVAAKKAPAKKTPPKLKRK